MGGGVSSSLSRGIDYLQSSTQPVSSEVIKIMMPVYYVHQKMTEADIDMAKRSWDLILNSSGQLFLYRRSEETNVTFPYQNCKHWFNSTFYERFFDIHPLSRPMFPNVERQGEFFVNLITLVFILVKADESTLTRKLRALAVGHCQKGVKATEYGIMGEALFWSLRHCLGEEFDKQAHRAWVVLFSTMLGIIVPVVIKYEMAATAVSQAELCRHRFSQDGEFKPFYFHSYEELQARTSLQTQLEE